MLNFYTSQTGEAAINSYYDYIDQIEKEEQELWEEAIKDKLWIEEPKLFIRMFGKKIYEDMVKKDIEERGK